LAHRTVRHSQSYRVAAEEDGRLPRSRLGELVTTEGAALLVRVWQYDVTPGHEEEFERLYGAWGA